MTKRKWNRVWGAVIAAALIPIVLLLWPDGARFLEKWQAWYGVLLGFLGLIYVTREQFVFARKREQERIEQEREGLIRALYFEVYNRAARCALDANTWLGFTAKGKPIHLSRFRKFRPTDPIVFPQAGDKLALLPADLLSPL